MIIGYCVGVFDRLHYGHKNILKKCKENTDKLIIGIHTDSFVQAYKRVPSQNQNIRRKQVITFLEIDPNLVVLIDDNHIELIKKFNINTIFHGTDWELESYKKQIKYYENGMDLLGINIKLIPYTKGISTTHIITSKVKNLNHKKCFLFDLDNTLVLNNKAKPFAQDIINKLKLLKKDYYVITNNNRYSPISINNILKKNSINFNIDNIISSLSTIKDYLIRESIYKVFIWGTNEAKQYLSDNGIINTNQNPELIIVLYNNTFNYNELVELCNLIKNIPYIIGNIDNTYPDKNSLLPDTGSIYKLLLNIVKKDPLIVFGKPNLNIIQNIVNKYTKQDIILIGDSLKTDKKLAINIGIDFLHIDEDIGDISNLGVICDYLN